MADSQGMTFTVKAIGIIHSPYRSPGEVPIQPAMAGDSAGEVEVFPEYAEGLRDLEGFSHIELIYYFHRASELGRAGLLKKPFLDDEEHGIFSIRYPQRPNPIGLSVVRLVGREGNRLAVFGIDVLDGTPLLDIKPHVPAYRARGELRLGWLEGKL